jgi:hypothetical protein
MMRLFEGKQFRMIIVTEGSVDHRQGESDWKELVDKCDKIGLFIDVVEIFNATPQKTILKSVAAGTHGDFIACRLGDVKNYMQSLSMQKKNVSSNQSQADKGMTAFLDIIAQPLDRIDDKITQPKQLLEFVTSKDEKTKCAICHSDYCMI